MTTTATIHKIATPLTKQLGMEKVGYMLALVLLLDVELMEGDAAFPPGYCQIYSYNIQERGSQGQERHFFVCCNNAHSKSCQGATYQKPSRPESFCSGQVIQQEGSHWTQMETGLFPEDGRFFCGGCCGQQTAKEICNQKMKKWDGCTNWAQCFYKQCTKIIHDHLSLKCTIPPPPHPKHYKPNFGSLPSNGSNEASTGNNKALPYPSCSRDNCEELDENTRCQDFCCQKYCCLQDGPQLEVPKSSTFHLTTVQIIGVCAGLATGFIAMLIIVCVVTKQCGPTCDSIKVPTNDTHVLVVEGPEEAEPEESTIS